MLTPLLRSGQVPICQHLMESKTITKTHRKATMTTGEHRIEHVMRHSRDMASRPAHGVFIGNGDRDTVLQLIDDAWKLAEAKSPKAKYEKSRGNDAWTVNMGRKVGFDGGKKGQRNGGKSLNSIKLILANGNQVITAYPVR